MPGKPDTIAAMLDRWAAERPDEEALRFSDQSCTWAQLADRVRRCATALRFAGVGIGDRVAVLDLNHPSCLEITLACSLIGAANAVVNFRLAPEEMIYVINDSDAKVLFAGSDFESAMDKMREHLPNVERFIVIGDQPDEYELWLAEHAPDSDLDDEDLSQDGVYPGHLDDSFVQLYTSGTTGFPKGAMLSSRAMLAHSANLSHDVPIRPDDAVLVAMPLYHVGGTSYALLALYGGARIVMTRMPDPATLLDLLERERITHTFFVPALLAMMVRVPGAAERDYSALRVLCYGASPMPMPVLRACMQTFPNVLYQVYGMTEACGVISSLGPAEHGDAANPHRLLSAGRPIPGCEIEIRDPATADPVPTGAPGEVWVRTEQVMNGYYRNVDGTRAAVVDGWLRSGDGGHLDADGYLYITDRIKDMIVSGGENVYPAEIERVLAEHPSVDDVAVIAVPDETWGEVPKAVVVAAPGADVDADELISYCRQRLASYKCPRSVDVVAELPRNLTGKVLKRELRRPYWENQDRQVH